MQQYAARTNLPPRQRFDLGDGIFLDLLLVPAGKFTMGAAEPKRPDEVPLRRRVTTGKVACFSGSGILLFMVAFVLVRAVRFRRRPQFSLRFFILMILSADVAVVGGVHWWHSRKELQETRSRFASEFGFFLGLSGRVFRAHPVTISTPFYVGKYEVTQEQYQQIMSNNPSQFRGPNLPVEGVSYTEAQVFCNKVNDWRATTTPQHEGEALDWTVRLPTREEWEYACRAGSTTLYNLGDNIEDLDRAGWYGENSEKRTHPVGQKEPNAWGLYDMHGNVWEWCKESDGEAPFEETRGDKGGEWRPPEACGGGFCWSFANCVSFQSFPMLQKDDQPDLTACGFRIVLVQAKGGNTRDKEIQQGPK